VSKKKNKKKQAINWWLMFVILATWEAEIRRQIVLEIPPSPK
jgi:hypothetical protein